MNYAIITENDESNWSDKTGEFYHHPKRYLKYITTGTKVIYYKGRITNNEYRDRRLTDQPHYFGVATIGKQYLDSKSDKEDYFSEIIDFKRFEYPVFIKINDIYLEDIPDNLKANYWRNAVRPIEKEIYDHILSLADINEESISYVADNYTTEIKEGTKKLVYTTKYERNPKLRQQAITLHGLSCMVCDFNFLKVFGELGRGFIHVHHINPLSNSGEQFVNPETDLVVLCPNCHSMIHRQKNKVMTVEELKELIMKYKK
ncbi:HNH endonuclease [Parabacteroides sp. APC149_11_2_Y6]